jgi:hypothetical protein
MAAQNNAAVLGLQKEKVLENAARLFSVDENTLQSKLMNNKNAGIVPVSKRALKIPLVVANGGLGGQFNSDGGNLGPGGGPTTTAGFVSTVGLIYASEHTAQSEWATDSQEKAIESNVALDAELALDTFKQLIDQLLHTDGSGTLATITAATGTTITVDNANQLYDGNLYQIISSDGNYTVRGGAAVQVNTVDPNNKQINLVATMPTGTIAGDVIVLNGASGMPASSLLGIYYTQVNSNTGTWQGINRATWPGKFTMPYVNANANTTTPQMVILAIALMKRALGSKTPVAANFVWHGDLEQQASWFALALNYTQIQRTALGTKGEDLLTQDAPDTIGGRPLIVSNHAKRGRLDGLCLKNWGLSVTKSLGQYKVGNQTVFPSYSTANGYPNSTMVSYYVTEMQVWNNNPQAGCVIGNIGATAGF